MNNNYHSVYPVARAHHLLLHYHSLPTVHMKHRLSTYLFYKATPSGNPVSGQGFPQDCMRVGGFCHYAIMHVDNSTQ